MTDREIADRLTREEGQNAIRTEIGQLREDMDKQIGQLREDMDKQIGQLREDMDKQVGLLRREDMNRQNLPSLTACGVGTFTALVIAYRSLWDRRTMLRPVESRVTSLEEEMSANRPRTAALLESLRNLSQRDPELPPCSKTSICEPKEPRSVTSLQPKKLRT